MEQEFTRIMLQKYAEDARLEQMT